MVTLTEKATEKAHELMREENKDRAPDKQYQGLRVYVRGGGCSGYQYGMKFEDTVADDDTVIEKDGLMIILDPQSIPLLNGVVIDYLDSLQGSGFAIKNPNAKTTCGCGSSFSA